MRALVFDRERCLACRSCELACALAHSQSRRLEQAAGEHPRPKARVSIVHVKNGLEALRCEQCAEPLCVFSCKSGALHRVPADGQVVFDDDRCVGCLMCLMVCPFGIRHDRARDRVARCDVCSALETPACVSACPTRAIRTDDAAPPRILSSFSGRIVIVGSSAAGMAAAEAAREHAPKCSITVVTADGGPDYSRPLLAYVLAGRIDTAPLRWRPERYLEDEIGATVLRGVSAVGLNPARPALLLSNGEEVGFDRLIVAAGARSAAVDIPGATLDGVSGLRDLDDLDRLNEAARPGARAVVVGGGNVGLQTCEALTERGLQVTLVVKSPYLLSQMVDEPAGRRVGELFARHGVVVRTRCDVSRFDGDSRVESVLLDNGEIVPADLVVIGKGIAPDLGWLRGTGVEVRRGVVIDASGHTSLPGIFAAGDCAECVDPLSGRSAISGIWPVAYEMGRAAGSTAVGVERTTPGALRMNASRFFGESIVSIGEVMPERLPGASAHVLVDRDDQYRKLVFREGTLVGALLYGDVSGAGVYYRLYRDRVALGDIVPEELEHARNDLAVAVVRGKTGSSSGF
jgi:nitrite reductase (NADH) large subunit